MISSSVARSWIAPPAAWAPRRRSLQRIARAGLVGTDLLAGRPEGGLEWLTVAIIVGALAALTVHLQQRGRDARLSRRLDMAWPVLRRPRSCGAL
jgi:hypothetical protein